MVLKVALFFKCLTAETSARTFREVIRLSSGKKGGARSRISRCGLNVVMCIWDWCRVIILTR